jgi:hypothetical protein
MRMGRLGAARGLNILTHPILRNFLVTFPSKASRATRSGLLCSAADAYPVHSWLLNIYRDFAKTLLHLGFGVNPNAALLQHQNCESCRCDLTGIRGNSGPNAPHVSLSDTTLVTLGLIRRQSNGGAHWMRSFYSIILGQRTAVRRGNHHTRQKSFSKQSSKRSARPRCLVVCEPETGSDAPAVWDKRSSFRVKIASNHRKSRRCPIYNFYGPQEHRAVGRTTSTHCS